MHRTLFHIANGHGPILLLRFGCRPVLLISSASAADDLLTKNDLVFANRPKLMPAKVFGCNCTNLAWAPHGDRWQQLRRASCLEILPCHRQPDQHDSLADEVKQLLCKLYSNKNVSVKLRPMFLDLVFNVMISMFAGKSYRQNITAEEREEINALLECSSRSFKITTEETDFVYFSPVLKLLGFTGLEQKCRKLQSKCDSLTDNLIENIRTHDGVCKKEENVIKLLLKRRYTNETIRGLVLVLMSAGTDTTAGTLEWALSLLLNHPKVLRKARDEIDKYVGNDRFIEQSDIDHLPYLRCIVKETMRLYPVAPLLVPHESSEDCTVGGYYVPKGTMLMLNVWAIQHDRDVWKDPTKFDPERFLDIVDERDGFKLMPFGYGRRSCPGKHMAVRVITMALGSLIHCFDFGEDKVDMTERTGLALFKDEPLEAVCRSRSTMENLLSQI
ncbi:hypothetical protein L1987_53461 [Smallanthus sonchifolius]|uniref:Uncharacterized protein n=1 Tax=Smallanthus sonchifolius TaxID=185202 RepID=A0ACB9EWC0_9ASTR|nr:hypothetical protein L1987_53461 [Smallanthus sonchifolius]